MFLTLCLLCASLLGFGQSIPNGNFSQFETIPCPFNATTTVKAYKDWVLYQTLDDHWDGPIDSNICISLYTFDPIKGIDLETVDLSRPIFARCQFTEVNKILLEKDWLYTFSVNIYDPSNQVFLQGGTGCADNMCSGFYIGIQIPDETGTGTAIRWHQDIPSGDSTVTYFSTCLPTEYFENNYLREFIMKLKVTDGTSPTKKLKLKNAYLNSYGAPNYITQVIAPQFTFVDTSYEVSIVYVADQPNWWNLDYMLLYTDHSSWPSSATPSYVEGRPDPNTTIPQTINLIVDNGTFTPQPFAILRGALVEGSDSIRHNLNLVNNGGDFCLGGIIDFVFDDNTKYIHKGGHVNMEGLTSCMMFRNGGTFEVAEGVTMQYGQDGRGMLALRSGGNMQLDKGSTLLFDGVLWLQGVPTAKHPDPQFYLDLKPGTSLIFGERANVLNANSTSPDVKFNVYMNGGILEDSKLNPAARLLINRIYPKPAARFSDNIKLRHNPSMGTVDIDYISFGNEQVEIALYDLQGRLIHSTPYSATEGFNSFEYDMNYVSAGVYIMNIKGDNGSGTKKVVKY